ncbi:FTR1 family iron permease [Paenibacillus sp. HW567]|uniref:FTR1 family iron permease n=1 Tax=Paenibacillus sp. HW567 TaxID=1034769 RepID=UPI00036B2B4E|nr:FTR1 family protein [Paenibacillus sp. HW567]
MLLFLQFKERKAQAAPDCSGQRKRMELVERTMMRTADCGAPFKHLELDEHSAMGTADCGAPLKHLEPDEHSAMRTADCGAPLKHLELDEHSAMGTADCGSPLKRIEPDEHSAMGTADCGAPLKLLEPDEHSAMGTADCGTPEQGAVRHPRLAKRRGLQAAVLFGCLFLLLLCRPAAIAAAEGPPHDELLPPVGSALVEAGQGRWDAAAADVESFAALWRTANEGTPDPALAGPAAKVDAALADAAKTLAAGGGTPAKTALSTLARSVDAYVNAASGTGGVDTAAAGRNAAAKLLPAAQRVRDAARSAEWTTAAAAYRAVVSGWKPVERGIRGDNPAVYGLLETKMSLLRIALQAEPRREDAALAEAEALYTLLADYSAGKAVDTANVSTEPATIEGLIGYLNKALAAAKAGDSAGAAGIMEQFISVWPSAEGQVQIASPKVYANIENESAAVTGDLLSNPPKLEQALSAMDNMLAELTPLAGDTTYTAWDAALILLREGLEAILVLAALLAYLKRDGTPKTQRWVWSGAAAGLAGSIGLAVLLSLTLSKAASGGARELIEGIAGLVAVVMMLTIGRWLHGKSSTAAWNNYVGRQVDGALAGGNLWSLFFIALIAILREGAETTIFYVGMAPSIAVSQLLLGIGGALVVLIILAYAIIALSARLPISAFFRTATVLIYYLVFRFLGESIHALQVAGKLPAHSERGLPAVGWLGLYPTWETLVPQLLILIFILWELLRGRASGKSRTTG